MPQRCADVFAWRRTFMSPVGPPPIMRLVLEGMSLFMISQTGGCCWLSVRRLGEITGLDKGTVSKHRTQAVAAGWLIAEGTRRWSLLNCPAGAYSQPLIHCPVGAYSRQIDCTV